MAVWVYIEAGLGFGDLVEDLPAFDDVETDLVSGGVDTQHDVVSRDDVPQGRRLVFGEVDENADIGCEFTQLIKIKHRDTPTQLNNVTGAIVSR